MFDLCLDLKKRSSAVLRLKFRVFGQESQHIPNDGRESRKDKDAISKNQHGEPAEVLHAFFGYFSGLDNVDLISRN